MTCDYEWHKHRGEDDYPSRCSKCGQDETLIIDWPYGK